MKRHNCLSDQDLTLIHYGEPVERIDTEAHLQACPSCRDRLALLQADLERIPQLQSEIDALTASRFAAKVTEQTTRRRHYWIPLSGGVLVASLALMVAVVARPPAELPINTVSSPQPVLTATEPLPDEELLEHLELLSELDILRELEGV